MIFTNMLGAKYGFGPSVASHKFPRIAQSNLGSYLVLSATKICAMCSCVIESVWLDNRALKSQLHTYVQVVLGIYPVYAGYK